MIYLVIALAWFLLSIGAAWVLCRIASEDERVSAILRAQAEAMRQVAASIEEGL